MDEQHTWVSEDENSKVAPSWRDTQTDRKANIDGSHRVFLQVMGIIPTATYNGGYQGCKLSSRQARSNGLKQKELVGAWEEAT